MDGVIKGGVHAGSVRRGRWGEAQNTQRRAAGPTPEKAFLRVVIGDPVERCTGVSRFPVVADDRDRRPLEVKRMNRASRGGGP